MWNHVLKPEYCLHNKITIEHHYFIILKKKQDQKVVIVARKELLHSEKKITIEKNWGAEFYSRTTEKCMWTCKVCGRPVSVNLCRNILKMDIKMKPWVS